MNEVKVGIMLPTHVPREQPFSTNLLVETAQWAEAQGFDTLWAGDHIVHPWQFLESLTSLTWAAAHTSRIEIGTCVLLLPMRQLAVVAAQLSALAVLSQGRFKLGIGVGGEWPREWQAAGISLKERGARLDEAIPLLRRLFAGEAVAFEGRFTTLPDVTLGPAPPHIPFYLAGRAPVALARAGTAADGWIGFFLTPNGFARDNKIIDEARRQANRLDQSFQRGMLLNFHIDSSDEIAAEKSLNMNLGFPRELKLAGNTHQLKAFALAGTARCIIDRLKQYISVGCNMFSLAPMDKRDREYREQLQILANEILPEIR
ncbi:hypothetical protein BSL82_18355 (plasmid) [Tardibacter chloracetimidivorans]|uniref:Luciferase-like domain-containing protein n=1 Tax=Tardibacter chloracetimidivorans TaxID=1921510 RepID=A0A1L4A0J8_9SPHN|nr:LLM class flavin-dependent oxidoreductase [Tardibacter chloracetimidivorans]API61403.1 hypothetical protein BSL82_18355 [Tardibacter chloracetimidivorans]